MESRLKLPKEEDSPVARQAKVLANDFISYRLGNSPIPVSPTAATLRRLADQIEEQYPLLLNHLCHKLNITRATVYQTFFEIASEVFADGINWGRIVALYAFGGKLAVYCDQHQMKELVASVTDWVARYVGAGLSEWIENHGGWVRNNFNRIGFYCLILLPFVYSSGSLNHIKIPRGFFENPGDHGWRLVIIESSHVNKRWLKFVVFSCCSNWYL